MIDDLQRLIGKYLEGGRNRTLQTLATKAGASYATVRRITQGEVRSVGLDVALSILQIVASRKEMLAYLETWFPDCAKIMTEFDSKAGYDEAATVDTAELLRSYPTWLALCLAERTAGVTSQELERLLGQRQAAAAIKMLESRNLIEDRLGTLHLAAKNFSTAGDASTNLAEIGHFCQAYDPERRAEPGHMLASMVAGWNDEGLKLVRETLMEAAVKLAEASNNPKYKGTTQAFWGTIAGIIGLAALVFSLASTPPALANHGGIVARSVDVGR